VNAKLQKKRQYQEPLMQLSHQELSAVHPVPDARGTNLFDADPSQALLRCYLPEDLHAHLLPHLKRLGGLAGALLDDLASVADKHPPTLSVRTRTGIDQSVVEKRSCLR